ncbi:hypothetical protein D3C78_1776240 [compost metagenome]
MPDCGIVRLLAPCIDDHSDQQLVVALVDALGQFTNRRYTPNENQVLQVLERSAEAISRLRHALVDHQAVLGVIREGVKLVAIATGKVAQQLGIGSL